MTQNSLIAREVYALSFIIGPMDAPEQAIWLAEHIPHRVRAAIARLPMESSILRVTATIDPKCLTEQQKIYWRCAADSIWERRLAATRWLIEFVGIKQGKGGNPVRCEKDPKYPDDVHIDDFDGGVPLNRQCVISGSSLGTEAGNALAFIAMGELFRRGDKFEKAELWGKNLIEHLAEIYGQRSRFVVMFVSKEYVEKAWTTHERRHAQERALLAQTEYILPARFDDTPVPGMTSTVGFVDLRNTSPSELVGLILQKLGKRGH